MAKISNLRLLFFVREILTGADDSKKHPQYVSRAIENIAESTSLDWLELREAIQKDIDEIVN